MEIMITNPIVAELAGLGILDPAALEKIADRTRDLDIPVYRDRASGVIVLASVATSNVYYEGIKPEDRENDLSLTPLSTGEVVKTPILDDANRRRAQFLDRIAGRVVCDFGAGHGEFLHVCLDDVAAAHAVELRRHCLDYMAQRYGTRIVAARCLADLPAPFDVVTMFHVLEHIPDQTASLRAIRDALRPGGELIVEVPHAGDFLVRDCDVKAFRDFTFWSEHLVLHTQRSLAAVLTAAGFVDVAVSPFQRYGFTNHFYWMKEGKPGGHERLKHLYDPALDAAYKRYLCERAMTDTLIATARRAP